MCSKFNTIVLLVFINCLFGNGDVRLLNTAPTNFISPSSYPNAKRDESVQDTYSNGVVIKDPYRWMENPESPETRKFVEEEMAITKPYLEKSPFRAEIAARYKELLDYPRFSVPFRYGNRFFSYQNIGLQNHYVLFMHDSFKDEGKVFIDPNTFSKNGTIAMGNSAFSDDGLIVAYTTSVNGSDWKTIQFKHVEKGDIYTEKLTKVKFSNIAWTHDNNGIFYSGYLDQKGKNDGTETTLNKNHKLYYHVLGTEQIKDIMVVEIPDNTTSNYLVEGKVSHCGKYLIVSAEDGSYNNLIYVADLDKIKYEIKAKLDLIPIVAKMEKNYRYVTNIGKLFIFRTNKDADNYKLITIDITNPDPKSWKDLVPEDKKAVLEWASVAFEKYIILGYVQDVKSVLQLHEIATGKMLKKFPLEIGTVGGFSSNKKYKDIFINFQSFLTPGIIYHCDLSDSTFELEIIKEIKLKNFDHNKYTAEQIFYESKDGTQVPMYIVHKKGLQKNGNNPVFMTAYGGFGITRLPYFSTHSLIIVDNFDGIFCVPNIRGGREYGEQWHRNGSLDKKQNSFDDFQAAAEFLIAENYTNSKLLAVNGGSNGGLLMGACLNQRPDLFGAVIADVGVLDMLRFDKFTDGHEWVSEYGTSSKPEDFEYLTKYSPLHNIKIPSESDKQYPATMITTSDHDDRVSPLHSLKFIAELQFQAKSHPNQKNPLILRVETDAGHGDGKPLYKSIEELVDKMCFIILNTGIKFHA